MEFTLTVARDKIMSSWFDMFAPGLNHTRPTLMRSEVLVMVVVTYQATINEIRGSSNGGGDISLL
jgi:hypothetical protein